MIKREEIAPVGKFHKPHGVKGEIVFNITDERCLHQIETEFLICEIDGIFVPFRLEEYRFTGQESALVKFLGIDSAETARMLANKDVFSSNKHFDENNDKNTINDWLIFTGYEMTDKQAGKVGIVKDVDYSTINTLFIVETEQDTVLIPAVEEFITEIDTKNQKLHVSLPDGLL